MKNNFTFPETKEALSHQLEALKKGKGKAMLVTPGEDLPTGIPKSMKTLETEVGTWIYNPLKIKSSEILRRIEDDTYYIILGHIEPKSRQSDHIVVAQDKDGREIKASVVSRENVYKQFKSLKKQFPKAEIEVGKGEKIYEVLGGRLRNGFTR